MVEDDVKNDAHPVLFRMCRMDQFHEVSPGSETRVDIEKVLDSIAVVAVLFDALAEDRCNPEGCDAKVCQIVQLRAYPCQSSPLKTVRPGKLPFVPAPLRASQGPDPGDPLGGAQVDVQKTVGRFLAVGKPVGKEKVEDFIPPVIRGRFITVPRRPVSQGFG